MNMIISEHYLRRVQKVFPGYLVCVYKLFLSKSIYIFPLRNLCCHILFCLRVQLMLMLAFFGCIFKPKLCFVSVLFLQILDCFSLLLGSFSIQMLTATLMAFGHLLNLTILN